MPPEPLPMNARVAGVFATLFLCWVRLDREERAAGRPGLLPDQADDERPPEPPPGDKP